MNDLTGKRFGRLLVLRRHGTNPNKCATWLCRCDCGNEKVAVGSYLTHGETRSCGCLRREYARDSMKTHGRSKTRLYRVWVGMKNRCLNEKTDNYQYYGAKGISICEEWIDDYPAFEAWALSHGYDDSAGAQECTLDRIDNSKDYSSDNCRWVDHKQQCNNQSSNRVFTYRGQTKTMSEWADAVGIKYATLRARIAKGMPFEKAIQPTDYRAHRHL